MREDDSAPDGVRALLKSAGRSRPMTGEARARSAARIDRLVAVPAAAGMVLWLKGVAIAAGLGVVGVVVVTRVLPGEQGESVGVVPAASAVQAASRGQVDIPAPTPVRASATPTAMPAPTPIPTPTPTAGAESDALAREVALLEKARSALDHDPEASLATLDACAAEFPSGTLSMERELLAVDALRKMGRLSHARTRGEALLGRARGSIYEERVQNIVRGLE